MNKNTLKSLSLTALADAEDYILITIDHGTFSAFTSCKAQDGLNALEEETNQLLSLAAKG